MARGVTTVERGGRHCMGGVWRQEDLDLSGYITLQLPTPPGNFFEHVIFLNGSFVMLAWLFMVLTLVTRAIFRLSPSVGGQSIR